MINRNGERIIPYSLRFLLDAIGCRNDTELIIVDDNSTDNSPQIISMLLSNHCLPFKEFIMLKQRAGPSMARNIGAQRAKGRFLAFLDNDILIHNKSIFDLIIEILNNNSDIDIVQPMIEPFSVFSTSWGGGGYITPTTFGYISKRCKEYQEIFYPLGSFFVIRKEVFESIRGFTPEYEYLFEEVSLAWKKHRCTNGKVICLPIKGIKHIGLRKGSPRATFLQWRNRFILVIENHKRKDILLISTLLLLRMLFNEPQYTINVLSDIVFNIRNLIKIKKRTNCKHDNIGIFQRFNKIIKYELLEARKVSWFAYVVTLFIYKISNLRALLNYYDSK